MQPSRDDPAGRRCERRRRRRRVALASRAGAQGAGARGHQPSAARRAAQDDRRCPPRSRRICARRSATISTATRRSSPTSSTSTRSSSIARPRATRSPSISRRRAAPWSIRRSSTSPRGAREVVAVVPEPPATAAQSRLNLLPPEARTSRSLLRRWQFWVPVVLLAVAGASPPLRFRSGRSANTCSQLDGAGRPGARHAPRCPRRCAPSSTPAWATTTSRSSASTRFPARCRSSTR